MNDTAAIPCDLCTAPGPHRHKFPLPDKLARALRRTWGRMCDRCSWLAGAARVNPVLTLDQVAEVIQLPVSWIRKAAADGDIPAFRAGRHWRFNREEIEAWRKQRSARETAARQRERESREAGQLAFEERKRETIERLSA